jgi:hypothetical protein
MDSTSKMTVSELTVIFEVPFATYTHLVEVEVSEFNKLRKNSGSQRSMTASRVCTLLTADRMCTLLTADRVCTLLTADRVCTLLTADRVCTLLTADRVCTLLTADRGLLIKL